jgi:hypothetical protein
MKTKNSLVGIMILTGILALSSCTRERFIAPSSKISTETILVEDFNQLRVGSAFNCYVSFENKEELLLEVNENLLEYVEVKIVNGELRIGIESGVNLRKGAELTAYVGANYLKGLSASGASRIYLRDVLRSQSLDVHVSGASRIKGDIKTDITTVVVSGASDLDLEGYTNDLELDASGASNIGGYDFECDKLDLHMSGASKAELRNEGEMHIRLSGASVFKYKGDGVIKSIKTSGASKVEKK